MSGGRDYDARKLQELIMYVAQRSLGDPRFGKTKLNKILFFSDFASYRSMGRSITGAVYQHLPQGPCPHQLLPALDALKGSIIEASEPTYAGTQKRLVPLRRPDLSLFSGEEIAIVDEIIAQLAPLTNTQVSDWSHETIAWRMTRDNQEIPYAAAILSADKPTQDDLKWLQGRSTSGELVTQ